MVPFLKFGKPAQLAGFVNANIYFAIDLINYYKKISIFGAAKISIFCKFSAKTEKLSLLTSSLSISIQRERLKND